MRTVPRERGRRVRVEKRSVPRLSLGPHLKLRRRNTCIAKNRMSKKEGTKLDAAGLNGGGRPQGLARAEGIRRARSDGTEETRRGEARREKRRKRGSGR